MTKTDIQKIVIFTAVFLAALLVGGFLLEAYYTIKPYLISAYHDLGSILRVALPLGAVSILILLGGALYVYGLSFIKVRQLETVREAAIIQAEINRALRDSKQDLVILEPGQQMARIAAPDNQLIETVSNPLAYDPKDIMSNVTKLLKASKQFALGAGNEGQQALPNPDNQLLPALPGKALLKDVLYNTRPSLNSVNIGVEASPQGLTPVIFDIVKAKHVIIGGKSGYGKTNLLTCFVLQLLLCPEVVKLAFIDGDSMTFPLFAPLGNKHMYAPIADKPETAKALLQSLYKESNQRAELFKAAKVTSFNEYHAQGNDPLPYIFCFGDEVTNLLDMGNKELKKAFNHLVRIGRKFGIFLVLSGQTWDSKTFVPAVLDQFSTRICFRTKAEQSAIVLDERGKRGQIASELRNDGECFVKLPKDIDPRHVKAYYVSDEYVKNIIASVADGEPVKPLELPAPKEDEAGPDKPTILDLDLNPELEIDNEAAQVLNDDQSAIISAYDLIIESDPESKPSIRSILTESGIGTGGKQGDKVKAIVWQERGEWLGKGNPPDNDT